MQSSRYMMSKPLLITSRNNLYIRNDNNSLYMVKYSEAHIRIFHEGNCDCKDVWLYDDFRWRGSIFH